jgi:hypothetical protein
MAAKSIFDRYFYTGSPVSIDEFSYEFTGVGVAELGSGFYFINSQAEATSYCKPRESNRQLFGADLNPTLHRVKLALHNPLDCKTIRALSVHEVKELIIRSPTFMEGLEGFGEVQREGLNKVLGRAAQSYAGHDDCPLIQTLNDLSSEFYGREIKVLNTALRDVLGYDGVFRKVDSKIWIVAAWFPEQIQIISRTKVISHDHESTGPAR